MVDEDSRRLHLREALDDIADDVHAPVAGLRRRLRRSGGSVLLVAQITLASSAAWLIAIALFDHVQPFFAPIAAVITVTAGLGQRRRVVVELVVGVSLGVGICELLIGVIGRGTLQLAVVVAVVALAAVLLGVGRLVVTQASASAILLVSVVPAAGSTGSAAVNRFIDALIGGVVGLVVTALIPANPVRRLDHAVGAVLAELASLLDATATALRWSDPGMAWTALQQGRALQAPLQALSDTTNTAHELSRISPLRWRQRDHVRLYARSLSHVDHAVRDARVLARRAHTMLRRGDRAGEVLVPVLARLAEAVRIFADELAEQDRVRRGARGAGPDCPRGDRRPRQHPLARSHRGGGPGPLVGRRPDVRDGRHGTGARRHARPGLGDARRLTAFGGLVGAGPSHGRSPACLRSPGGTW